MASANDVINSILSDLPAAGLEDPKPTVQPDQEPQREVDPVTPDNLPSGTPGTPDAPDPSTTPPASPTSSDADDLNAIFLSPPGGPIWPDEGLTDQSPSPATPTTPPSTPPSITLSDGSTLTLDEIEALRRAALSPTPPAPAPPLSNNAPAGDPSGSFVPDPLAPQLPQFTEEDLENPAIRAVVLIAARQQQELARLTELQQQTSQEITSQRHRENAEIVNSAVTAFRTQYNVPEDIMSEVSSQASHLLDSELRKLVEAGNPNPYLAVVNSLSSAYWLVPRARQFEFERQSTNRQKSLARKQRLNGVGGTSGVAPHTAEPSSLHDSLVAQVAEAMGVHD